MKSHFSEEQIFGMLKHQEAGIPTAQICREHGISAATFYKWNAPRGHPDFVHDALCDGRSFRTLNVLDAYTRQCLHIEADTSLSGERVVRVLDGLLPRKGKPQVIQIDNGPEFRGHKMDIWAFQNQVKLHFIDPGKQRPKGTRKMDISSPLMAG